MPNFRLHLNFCVERKHDFWHFCNTGGKEKKDPSYEEEINDNTYVCVCLGVSVTISKYYAKTPMRCLSKALYCCCICLSWRRVSIHLYSFCGQKLIISSGINKISGQSKFVKIWTGQDYRIIMKFYLVPISKR
jgi:hypothetical protein